MAKSKDIEFSHIINEINNNIDQQSKEVNKKLHAIRALNDKIAITNTCVNSLRERLEYLRCQSSIASCEKRKLNKSIAEQDLRLDESIVEKMKIENNVKKMQNIIDNFERKIVKFSNKKEG
ncbi:unnamed protein product [Gordionus sp. m RMFG-2023]